MSADFVKVSSTGRTDAPFAKLALFVDAGLLGFALAIRTLRV
jgi:hypothetical protein